MDIDGKPSRRLTRVRSRAATMTRMAIAAAVLVSITPDTARAYIDPGAGSLLWQAVVAGLFGVSWMVRRHVRIWYMTLRRLLGRKEPEETQSP
jgi:hypothetical protein